MMPDWVMLGVDLGEEGVCIYASSELTEAELLVVERFERLEDWPASVLAHRSRIDYIVLSANMKTYVWVRGATYADALHTLFGRWKPWDQKPAVGGPPALPPTS